MANEETAVQGQDHGVRSSRLQKGRFTRAGDARDRARAGQAHRQGTMGADLREARRGNGSRETSLRQCGPLRRAGLLDARLPARVEHASVRGIARRGLVRARH